MQKKDYLLCGLLLLTAIIIFYPVLYTDYIYTDEVPQLWHYSFDPNFTMYSVQGRWIPQWIFKWAFYNKINTVHGVNPIRVLSLGIWFVCIPMWYMVIKRMVANKPLYEYLPFFTCLYLVTSLPFAVSVQWVTCIELSIGNTAGLLAGAVLYFGIRDKEKLLAVPVAAALGAGALAQLSLFTYQSCFACFLVPFLFHFVSGAAKKELVLIKGLAFYFAMYGIWYLLFKLSLSLAHLTSDPRAGLHIDIPSKVGFFFAQPLKRAFWFNVIANDDNKLAKLVYRLLFVGWVLLVLVRYGKQQWLKAAQHVALVFGVFVVSYVPSLLVKENYSSNRTLQAIDMCVWIVCAEMVLYMVKAVKIRTVVGAAVAVLLLVMGFYNFRYTFLKPVHEEYVAVRNFIQQQYTENIKTVYFIKPAVDAFEKKYHVQRSMDEFGRPSLR